MKKKLPVFSLIFILYLSGSAQTHLQQYIQEGLQKNKGIQQQAFVLEQNMYGLQEAQRLFLPAISFNTDYFLAAGGRTVDFPAGDILNPVYATLNQLTASNGFPKLENQRILLNPNNFYDVRFRTTMPLINKEIGYSKRIKQEEVNLQQLEINLYKRELVKDIKTGYYKFLQAHEAIRIYEVALAVVNENMRINNALFKNDKVNAATVLRSENEVVRYKALLHQAAEQKKAAQSYFNFLLNRDLQADVLTDSIDLDIANFDAAQAATANREELQKLQIAQTINTHLLGLSTAYKTPKLNTFLDVGSQGFDAAFNNRTLYTFFGLSMQWDIFSFGRNKLKSKQAEMNLKINNAQTSQVQDQLNLQLSVAINNYRVAQSQYEAASSVLLSSARLYRDFLSLYKAGSVLYVELLDAQNQYVQATLQATIARYDAYIKAAEIERAAASFELNNL